MSNTEEHLVALDIGTTKICCIVATVDEDKGLMIKGMGTAPSCGLSRGRVNNINETVKAINKAVADAADKSGYEINSAYVGIAGDHIAGRKVHGSVAIRSGTVTKDDIERAIRAAMVMQVPADAKILTRIPLEYHIDDRVGIIDPMGMRGTRLDVYVHAFTVSAHALDDLAQCVLSTGLGIDDIFLESVASAEAVLTPAEKQQGVVLLDIGGGTCDMAVFVNGAIHHIFEVAMGGDALTHDLATALNISLNTAEILKVAHGCCYPKLIEDDYDIEVPSLDGVNTVNIGASKVAHFLNKRIDELFAHINKDLVQSGYDEVARNIVLTGGSALLQGLPEMGLEYFNRQIRVGYPNFMGGVSDTVANPIYSTAVGLLLYGPNSQDPLLSEAEGEQGRFRRALNKFKSIFS
jgi:cell division protein FtsA